MRDDNYVIARNSEMRCARHRTAPHRLYHTSAVALRFVLFEAISESVDVRFLAAARCMG